ncbi:hypothetical protein [Marinobacter daepoensis]|uniref:hypothetical protein n=1 Tax=Marinobacter daepoensis TaxID=262077 RepID=UPI0012EB4CD6|nr:hypothetical protein [Marinobacter daepoensis]
MSNFDYLPLIQLLCSADTVRVESDTFVFLRSSDDKASIDTVLSSAGYLDETRSKDGELYFTLNADRWDELPPIYKNAKAWWDKNSRATQLDTHYYIVDLGVSSIDDDTPPLITASKATIEFRSLIVELSDHQIEAENTSLFFVHDKEEPIKLRISLAISYEEVVTLSKIPLSLEAILSIKANLCHDDPHQKERNEVMRRSIVKMLEGEHGQEGLFFLLNNFEELKRKYKEQYDLYVHNFSVSKLLSEIDQRSLEFNSKLMDFISSSQNKALTIPGALIAMGALVRSKGLIEIFLILIGVWMVKHLVTTANEILRGTFEDLKWQIDTSFKKYKSLSEGHEVYESAQQNQDKLTSKITKAEEKIRNVDKLARGTFWVAVLYSLWLAFDSYQSNGNSVTSFFEVLSSVFDLISLKVSEIFSALEAFFLNWLEHSAVQLLTELQGGR